MIKKLSKALGKSTLKTMIKKLIYSRKLTEFNYPSFSISLLNAKFKLIWSILINLIYIKRNHASDDSSDRSSNYCRVIDRSLLADTSLFPLQARLDILHAEEEKWEEVDKEKKVEDNETRKKEGVSSPLSMLSLWGYSSKQRLRIYVVSMVPVGLPVISSWPHKQTMMNRSQRQRKAVRLFFYFTLTDIYGIHGPGAIP